jgi:hypothetical protein
VVKRSKKILWRMSKQVNKKKLPLHKLSQNLHHPPEKS